MSDENKYELKKDIWTPDRFWRAGMRKNKEDWMKEFNLDEIEFKWSVNEWFLDLSEKKDEYTPDELYELITSVFTKRGLHSISYKEAAMEVASLWLRAYLESQKGMFKIPPNFHE